MSLSVWKYNIDTLGPFEIQMPEGAQPLVVQMQQRMPRLWMLVESTAPLVTHGFQIIGTGHKLFPPATYIGTFQMLSGKLVWHLFDSGEQA